MSNISVIIGSPRKGGNTQLLADSFIRGAVQAGNTVDVISVADYDIHGCLGCNACFRNDGLCVQNDGMAEIYSRLSNADIIVFATPIYFFTLSSQLKAIIDRLHNPIRDSFSVRKLVLLVVSASAKETVYEPVLAMYKAALSHFSLEDGGVITVGGMKDKGDILNYPALKQAFELGQLIE